jgi:hypothetical protein
MWERAVPDPGGGDSWGRRLWLAVKPVARGGRTTRDMCRRVVSPAAPEAGRGSHFMASEARCQLPVRAHMGYMPRRSEAEPR